MTNNSRLSPTLYFYAGLSGVVAWLFPYLFFPFVRLIPFLHKIPDLDIPPFRIDFPQWIASYIISWLLAMGLLEIGINAHFKKTLTNKSLNFSLCLISLLAAVIGAVISEMVGLMIGYSRFGIFILKGLDILILNSISTGPEPFLSIGLALGMAVTIMIISSYLVFTRQLVSAKLSATRIILDLTLRTFWMVLAARLLVYLIQYSSFVQYNPISQSMVFLFLLIAIDGALFGILTLLSISNQKDVQIAPLLPAY